MGVTTTPAGPDRLQVTLTVSGANNALRSLRFGAATNATIEAGGQSGPGSLMVSLPAATRQYGFAVRRTTAGQAITVPLTVVDGCGEWPTFVGGGASSF
jgi:hypothetical protein